MELKVMMSLSITTLKTEPDVLTLRQSEQFGGLTPGNSVLPCGRTGKATAHKSTAAMNSFLIDFSLHKLAHLGM
jgi:hypothetical protein